MDNEFITLRYAATVQLLRYVSNDFANFYTMLVRLCRCLKDLEYVNLYYYLKQLYQYVLYDYYFTNYKTHLLVYRSIRDYKI